MPQGVRICRDERVAGESGSARCGRVPYHLSDHGGARQLTSCRLRKVQEILREAPPAWPAPQNHGYDVARAGRRRIGCSRLLRPQNMEILAR
jgi:hypothetical protein